jgi:hypothetical protein
MTYIITCITCNMPTCYTVCDEEYASKAALQREWRDRSRRYSGPGRVSVSQDDSVWFMTAAFVSVTHRKFLFGGEYNDLSKCLTSNTVHVDIVGASSARYKVSKYMRQARCVFFVSMADPTRSHTSSSNLGDSQSQKIRLATTGWLRQSVQSQIDAYRRKRKMQASLLESVTHRPYNCDICHKSCRGKENHIDHGTGDKSFKSILKNFQTECLLREVTVEDGQHQSVRSKWQKYHRQKAQLSLTCKMCNLTNK